MMKIITPTSTDCNISGVSFIWPANWEKKYQIEDVQIIIGENVIFRPPCIIYWGCSIGDFCQISHNTVIREKTQIGNHSKIGNGTTLDGNLTIGNHVSIHTLCFISNNVNIEDHVFIGPGCTITNTKRITHGRNFPLIEEGPIIKFGARIGGGCTILPKVVIGREALIGAGSVVTKNIPDFQIAYGSPARLQGKVPPNEYL